MQQVSSYSDLAWPSTATSLAGKTSDSAFRSPLGTSCSSWKKNKSCEQKLIIKAFHIIDHHYNFFITHTFTILQKYVYSYITSSASSKAQMKFLQGLVSCSGTILPYIFITAVETLLN